MAKRGRPRKSEAEKSPLTKAYENALKSCDKGFKYILDNYNPLTREEEKTASADDLVLHNFRYMFRAFKKFLINIPLSEYCSEIYAGLYEAVRKFDRTKNIKFITFAQAYVNLYLLNYARKQENIISFNPSAINKIKTMQKFIYNYRDEFDRDPTPEEVCKKFKLSMETYQKYLFYCNSFLVNSLDEVLRDGDKGQTGSHTRTRADVISGKDVVDQDDVDFVKDLEKKELLNEIQALLKSYSKLEQNVIKDLYINNRSVKETAKRAKITSTKVTKIRETVLSNLRAALV